MLATKPSEEVHEMARIVETVEIARSPEDVFAFLDDIGRLGEWQQSLVRVHVETEAPTRVGTRAVMTRKLGRREMTSTSEITAHDPPRSLAFRTLDGAVRAVGRIQVDATGDGSLVTLELDFEGHGLGWLLVPMVRKQAAKQVPSDHRTLKELLETGRT